MGERLNIKEIRLVKFGVLCLFLLSWDVRCYNSLKQEEYEDNLKTNSQTKYYQQEGVCMKPANGNDRSCLEKEEKCVWGYEDSCPEYHMLSRPVCSEVQSWRVFASNEDRIHAFWNENDFGYVKSVKKLNPVCTPKEPDDSIFECNEQLTFCRGRNIYFDFTSKDGRSTHERAQSKPFSKGQFGGSCEVHPEHFKGPMVFRDKLRSWAADDIDHFEALPFKPSHSENCDVTVETPTMIMDLDFFASLYHHFCDFFNLYVTLHVNGSLHQPFDVALWQTMDRLGPFGATWKVFTNNVYPIWTTFAHKKVCFKDVVFALLPRMANGMFYSTPVVHGCSKSRLFKEFSDHIVNGLNVTQERKSKSGPLRITFLYRTTKYRRILNQDELLDSIRSIPGVLVNSVDFNRNVPFIEQMKISHNSDLFIGIHGAGLAHVLFMPDWAVLFELYNTGDINCYKDLSRLRGVTYLTWEKNEKIKEETDEPHPDYDQEKFRNFRFDVSEFARLVNIAVENARDNLRDSNLP